MSELVEYTFYFKDLLGSGRASNQRWIEIMEVLQQLFEEFVYPELERTKKLKSIYTAADEDLDRINIDKYYYLFENIQASASTKRIGLWLQSEIIKAKNREDSIFLAVASLGLPREALTLLELFSRKTGEYTPSSLRTPEQVENPDDYFLTSRTGFYLDQVMLSNFGIDAAEAQEAVKNILLENVIPTHIDLQILVEIWSRRSDIKIVPDVKPFSASFPAGDNTVIDYQLYNERSDVKVVPSANKYNQFIIKEKRPYATYNHPSMQTIVADVKSYSQFII